MNYREWLLYRAQKYEKDAGEPQVLRYTSWQNYQLMRDWVRRADAAEMLNFTRGGDQVASSSQMS
jgi:hypothetical protein